MTIPPEILDRLVSIRVKCNGNRDWVTVERRDTNDIDGFRWTVCHENYRLSRVSGEWDYPSMPSNRPEGWNEAHQWATFAEAWEAATAVKVD